MGDAPTPPELDTEFEHVADMRQGDRRHAQRRSPRAKLDTLFAVTLMAQIEAAPVRHAAYPARRMRRGFYVNLRA
jgi:hypothetical protein